PRSVAVVEYRAVFGEEAVGGGHSNSLRTAQESLHRTAGPTIHRCRRPIRPILRITQLLSLAGIRKTSARQLGGAPPGAALKPVICADDDFPEIVNLRIKRYGIVRQ